MDIIAANLLGRALYVDAYASTARPVNIARYAFLARNDAEHFYPDWDLAADQIVGILRAEAGRDPHSPDLQDLIGQLSTLSEEFRIRWAAHDVRRHDTGEKHFRHRVAGELYLLFESSDLPIDPGWKLQIYTAEPGSHQLRRPPSARQLGSNSGAATTPHRVRPAGGSMSVSFDFRGQVALVTGASSGMGLAAARAFADAGVDGARRHRRDNGPYGRGRAGRRGADALALVGDVSDEAQVTSILATTVATYGRLDAAFNNAAHHDAGDRSGRHRQTPSSTGSWQSTCAAPGTASNTSCVRCGNKAPAPS